MSSTSMVSSAKKSMTPVVARMSSHWHIGSASCAVRVMAVPFVAMSAASLRSVRLPFE